MYGKKHVESYEALQPMAAEREKQKSGTRSGEGAKTICATSSAIRGGYIVSKSQYQENKKISEDEREKDKERATCKLSCAHPSVPTAFMIVSLPEDAAFTICCSTDLFILALSACITIQSGVRENGELYQEGKKE